jgi:hypothetical protein
MQAEPTDLKSDEVDDHDDDLYFFKEVMAHPPFLAMVKPK